MLFIIPPIKIGKYGAKGFKFVTEGVEDLNKLNKKADKVKEAEKSIKKASGAGKILDINIKEFEIKNKHLNSSTAKRARKFNVSSAEEANKIVQEALKNVWTTYPVPKP
ncbi:hypothetical protein HCJ02_01600 [Listeria seeligeri]|uniref:hypothetical protein n=1 Tax=Listeria TaxID=1637 RepID=UPI001625491B|nr:MULTISPECIES: hypothetical protein [Listeria]MBC1532028.1 hypothetical protein [Listeria seeligeri]MBC1827159.1 hypothetical protein [Listeria seeligeri]MBC1840049.1 hypothetical protein [Listeria seeligeri]MBC2030668.1 hypothetical protein [Listeria seeligeri]MBC6115152.1 hypothetical protein [Listeria seeligeri]